MHNQPKSKLKTAAAAAQLTRLNQDVTEIVYDSAKWQNLLQRKIRQRKSGKNKDPPSIHYLESISRDPLPSLHENALDESMSNDGSVQDLVEDCSDITPQPTSQFQVDSNVGSRAEVFRALGIEASVPFPFNIIQKRRSSDVPKSVSQPVAVPTVEHKSAPEILIRDYRRMRVVKEKSFQNPLHSHNSDVMTQSEHAHLVQLENHDQNRHIKPKQIVSLPHKRVQSRPLHIEGEAAMPNLKEILAQQEKLTTGKVTNQKSESPESKSKYQADFAKRGIALSESKKLKMEHENERSKIGVPQQCGVRPVSDEKLCGWESDDEKNIYRADTKGNSDHSLFVKCDVLPIAAPRTELMHGRITTPTSVGAFLRKYEFEGNSAAMAYAYCKQCQKEYSFEELKGYIADIGTLQKELKKLSVAVALATACKQLILAHDLTSQAGNITSGMEQALKKLLRDIQADELNESEKAISKATQQIQESWKAKEEILDAEFEQERSKMEAQHDQMLHEMHLEQYLSKHPLKLSQEWRNLHRAVETLTKQKEFLRANDAILKLNEMQVRETAEWESRVKVMFKDEIMSLKAAHSMKLTALSKSYAVKRNTLRTQRDAELKQLRSKAELSRSAILQRGEQIMRKRLTELQSLIRDMHSSPTHQGQRRNSFLDLFSPQKSQGVNADMSAKSGKKRKQKTHAKDAKMKGHNRKNSDSSLNRIEQGIALTVDKRPDIVLFICGGTNGSIDLSGIDVNSEDGLSWKAAGTLRTPRCWFAMATSSSRRAWVVGGRSITHGGPPSTNSDPLICLSSKDTHDEILSSTEIWDLLGSKPTCYPGPPLKKGRHDFTVTYVNGELFAMGGTTLWGTSRSVEALSESYSPADVSAVAWRRCQDMPEPRCGHAAVGFGSLIYVFGGRDETHILSSACAFSPERGGLGIWIQLPPMPTARTGAAAAVFEDAIYLLGGRGADGHALATVDRFWPRRSTWERVVDMPSARWGGCAVALGKDIWLMGGCGPGGEVVDRVERLDPATLGWHDGPHLRYPRAGFAAACLSSVGHAHSSL